MFVGFLTYPQVPDSLICLPQKSCWGHQWSNLLVHRVENIQHCTISLVGQHGDPKAYEYLTRYQVLDMRCRNRDIVYGRACVRTGDDNYQEASHLRPDTI